MKQNLLLIAIGSFVIISGCNNNESTKTAQKDPAEKTTVVKPYDTIPEFRSDVKKEPIDSYREKTENPLNDWYFQVKLYETEKTFYYLMKLEYEEIRGVDTLKLPNFGIPPQPVIRKGPEKYSCIIGFLDKEKKFREYKKVYVKNNALKVTAIKRYSVATYQKE